MDGRVTRQKICHGPAPSVAAACSWSVADLLEDRQDRPGDVGDGDERRGHDDPGSEKITWIPWAANQAPNQPPVP